MSWLSRCHVAVNVPGIFPQGRVVRSEVGDYDISWPYSL